MISHFGKLAYSLHDYNGANVDLDFKTKGGVRLKGRSLLLAESREDGCIALQVRHPVVSENVEALTIVNLTEKAAKSVKLIEKPESDTRKALFMLKFDEALSDEPDSDTSTQV